jgi:hypothetical protein
MIMNALNFIPVIGWLVAWLICLFVAIPVDYLWNWLVPIYAYQLPTVYQNIPFWNMVGLLWLIMSIKDLFCIIISISNTNKKD